MSRTHRNIADIEEKKGSKYSVLFKYFMASYEAARGAKNKKLQIHILEDLVVVQNVHKQNIHKEEF